MADHEVLMGNCNCQRAAWEPEHNFSKRGLHCWLSNTHNLKPGEEVPGKLNYPPYPDLQRGMEKARFWRCPSLWSESKSVSSEAGFIVVSAILGYRGKCLTPCPHNKNVPLPEPTQIAAGWGLTHSDDTKSYINGSYSSPLGIQPAIDESKFFVTNCGEPNKQPPRNFHFEGQTVIMIPDRCYHRNDGNIESGILCRDPKCPLRTDPVVRKEDAAPIGVRIMNPDGSEDIHWPKKHRIPRGYKKNRFPTSPADEIPDGPMYKDPKTGKWEPYRPKGRNQLRP
jgi:hypothetical protein